jgi:hypothetical protein
MREKATPVKQNLAGETEFIYINQCLDRAQLSSQASPLKIKTRVATSSRFCLPKSRDFTHMRCFNVGIYTRIPAPT